jgi:hypothetical protein
MPGRSASIKSAREVASRSGQRCGPALLSCMMTALPDFPLVPGYANTGLCDPAEQRAVITPRGDLNPVGVGGRLSLGQPVPHS